MNPARYKAVTRQRSLERRSEKDDLLPQLETMSASVANPSFKTAAPVERAKISFPASYLPLGAHPFKGWKHGMEKFNLGDGGSLAASSALSSWSMGLEGFDDVAPECIQLGQFEGTGGSAYELSALAPGTLSGGDEGGRWTRSLPVGTVEKHVGTEKHQKTVPGGFDAAAGGMFDSDTDPLTSSSSPPCCGGEALRGSSMGLRVGSCGREAREVEWRRLPGETSISQSVRLYLSHLDSDASHLENCELVLRQILERVGLEELDVPAFNARHLIKLEAFLRGVVMSVPPRTWQESVKGAFVRSAPADTGSNGTNIASKSAAHISKDELTFRMSLFVSIMKAERAGDDEADVAVDSMRVESVVRSFAANAAEHLPLQRPARTLLPPLLLYMTCEMLGVRLPAPEVRDVCHQIVIDYEERSKLWMSPAQNADRYLRPLVTEFAAWLRLNRDVLYEASATEGLLQGIDPALRQRLKNQVYHSPEHFLEVLDSLSPELTDMPLPPYNPSGCDSSSDHGRSFDVSQTLKDVSRERFEINGVPIESSECWAQICALLLQAASELSDFSCSPGENATHGTNKTTQRKPLLKEGLQRRGGEGPLETSCGDAAAGKDCFSGSAKSIEEDHLEDVEDMEAFVERCAWRVMHAASRTASGGDSFFVVQDLFGGEGVLVKMSTAAPECIKIDIDLEQTGMSATVTTVDKHDIYHTSDVDIGSSTYNSRSEASPQPLMTIITTMKEVIHFKPYTDRATLSEHQASNRYQPGDVHKQRSFSRSGRSITIAASLPEYADPRHHHVDGSGGVLIAPPPSPAALSPMMAPMMAPVIAPENEQVHHHLDNGPVGSKSWPDMSALMPHDRRGDGRDDRWDDSVGRKLTRRPSAFSSPLPPSPVNSCNDDI